MNRYLIMLLFAPLRKFVATIIVSLLLQHVSYSQDKLYPNEFPLEDVKLLDGPFKHARDLNLKVLLQYDVDRLLAPYRKEAGLTPKAKPYPNWDGLDGHVGGHYLTAMAMNYATTGNEECWKRMNYMLSELKECQQANAVNNLEWGKGYAGGIPNSKMVWSTLKAGDLKAYRSAWVPWYNLHKMYAGLRDAWLFADREDAKTMFLAFCDWGIQITSRLSEDLMQSMLDIEHGGMNEIFADAYQMTGDEKYLQAARRFSHRALLEPFSEGRDNLDNKHANTQIPKFIGFERISELSRSANYENAAKYFWEAVTTNRTIVFGGNSRREHFPTRSASIDYILEEDGPETCNSYNMLKLTEGLFRNHPDAKYVDYYERTLYNHILASQHPVHGGYVYFTPTRPRHYRVYSAPNEAMWCCVGTGMENHSKYNQIIFTHTEEKLYLNLFISSELDWKEKKIKLKQETNFPFEDKTRLTVTSGSSNFELMIRYPGWVVLGELSIRVNGIAVSYGGLPQSYVSISRKWRRGDVVEIQLPMKKKAEHLPNVPEYVAFMYGPIVLGAPSGTHDLKGLIADDGRWAQHPAGEKLPIDQAPILVEDDLEDIAEKLEPVAGQPLNFKLNLKAVNRITANLKPFFQLHDSRYMLYWLALTNDDYKSYTDSLSSIENDRITLEQRTLDRVVPGEQQPENDHAMQQENSSTGVSQNEFYRDARGNGYFSYEMATNSKTHLSLFVRYWGAEWGNRKFEIYIDDQKLVTEDNTGRWNVAMFKECEYAIPDLLLDGKKKIRIKFQSLPGNTVGGVFDVRILQAK